ncbi:hypothetical protein DCCM_3753 [Desulfocucumis palustris]|uniref:Uncharacterized protein n=2 Tax=Desulfocucumis palustris TaxID=1898651 RepID=A0A2L2XFY9_9FIRM|nr:hypothetical protein DCCM_3753 [Desulfocucumis palustris]
MPGGVKGKAGSSSGVFTDVLPNDSVVITDGDENKVRKYRNRPRKEKAVKKTYSFNTSTVRALEEYAEDNGMSYSQVINLALRQLIPRHYFEDRD